VRAGPWLCQTMPNQPISPSRFLHPSSGKKSKYKTSVRRKTLNPEFNEVGHGWETPVQCPLDLANLLSLFLKLQRTHIFTVPFPTGILLCRSSGGASPEGTAGVCVGL
jgi:hypothetical protein